MDLNAPYTDYVVAAYAVAIFALALLAASVFRAYFRQSRGKDGKRQ